MPNRKTSINPQLANYWGVDFSLIYNCIQCGKCEAACTQKLPIMERFELIKKELNAGKKP